MANNRDFDLIGEFRKANPRAFKVVYDIYFPVLCYFARGLLYGSPESEEIAADSMIKLFNRSNDFESLQNIRAFLFITTRNACFNFLTWSVREHDRKKELEAISQESKEKLALSEMIRAEVMREIYKEIEELPEACREVFQLLYLEGKNANEVARQLNISIVAVWEQRQEALRLLRTILLKKGLLAILLAYGAFAFVA